MTTKELAQMCDRDELAKMFATALRERDEALREGDKARARAAEMRDIIYRMYHWDDDERSNSIDADARRALANDCGKGWRSPEDYAQLEGRYAELRRITEWLPYAEMLPDIRRITRRIATYGSCNCSSLGGGVRCDYCAATLFNEMTTPESLEKLQTHSNQKNICSKKY